MTRVYTTRTLAIASNVKNALEAGGIDCVLRNEFLGAGLGELPPAECWPEVWVVDDRDAERAREIVAEGSEERRPFARPWRCSHCGERIEAVFARCWRCGREERR